MATQKKKTSTARKRPSSNKKSGNTGTGNKKNAGKNRTPERSVPPFFKREFILLMTLGISLFLLLADLGIGSGWLKSIGKNMREFLGILNYVLPFGLFFGVAFLMANPGSVRAKVKFISGCLVYAALTILFSLLLPWDKGFFGGMLGNLIAEGIGLPLTVILILLFILLNIVIITEKSFVQAVEDGSRKVYDTAKQDAIKRREQMEERREIRIAESRKVRNEGGKAYGVPMDIRLESSAGDKQDLHEIKIRQTGPMSFPANTENPAVKTERVHTFLEPEETLQKAAGFEETEEIREIFEEPAPVKRRRKRKKEIIPEETVSYFSEPDILEADNLHEAFDNVPEPEKAPDVLPKKKAEKKAPVTSANYQFPPVSLLKKGKSSNNINSNKALTDLARRLEQTLLSFGVKVTVNNVTCGPSVTRFELLPEVGTKVSKITSLEDDIKMNLAAATIRIEAPIPGKAAIGIEIPNEKTQPVLLRDLIESYELKEHPSKIAFAAGKNISGKVIVGDIGKFPHMLVAGTTGSGKSVYTNSIIMSILYRATPEEVRLIVIDPKVVEFQVYDGIPHLLIPVVTDPKKASGALNWAVGEMNNRYNLFAEQRVRDLKDYNEKILNMPVPEGEEAPKPLPQIVIIIDELADLMMVAKNEVETSIVRIAQLARAAGIHMIIATQRPSVDVVTGLIKANMPSRTSLRVSTGTDSRVVIDQTGAEKLLGNGDMLFYPAGFKYPERVQGAYVTTEEIENTVEFLKEHNKKVEYDQAIEDSMNAAASGGAADTTSMGVSDELDSYFVDAGKYIIDKNKASIGNLQRVFKIGFNRAARIMDQLCDAGVVGEEQGTKPREVLMSLEEFEQYIEDYV